MISPNWANFIKILDYLFSLVLGYLLATIHSYFSNTLPEIIVEFLEEQSTISQENQRLEALVEQRGEEILRLQQIVWENHQEQRELADIVDEWKVEKQLRLEEIKLAIEQAESDINHLFRHVSNQH